MLCLKKLVKKASMVLKEINRRKQTSKILYKHNAAFEEVPKQKSPDLSIIIPAYNEERTIGSVIKTIRNSVSSHKLLYEIIIINDGSTDRTKEEVEKTRETVIHLEKNLGKANALRIGFKASSGMNLLTMDADGSHQQEDINALIETYFNKGDHMIIGSRFMGKQKSRFTSSMNIVGNKIFKYVLFLLSGKYITDSQSGLRIFDRRVLRSIDLISKGYKIESELTAKMIGLGYKVSEIPINCRPRVYGKSNLNSILDGIKILKTIIHSYFLGRISFNSAFKKMI